MPVMMDAARFAELAQMMTLPHQLVPRFASHLKLPRPLENLAKAVAEQLTRLELLTGKPPQLQAATAIYLAHFLFPRCKATKEGICKEAKVSGANMLRCFKDISPHWKSLIPADTQAKVGENTLSALLSQ